MFKITMMVILFSELVLAGDDIYVKEVVIQKIDGSYEIIDHKNKVSVKLDFKTSDLKEVKISAIKEFIVSDNNKFVLRLEPKKILKIIPSVKILSSSEWHIKKMPGNKIEATIFTSQLKKENNLAMFLSVILLIIYSAIVTMCMIAEREYMKLFLFSFLMLLACYLFGDNVLLFSAIVIVSSILSGKVSDSIIVIIILIGLMSVAWSMCDVVYGKYIFWYSLTFLLGVQAIFLLREFISSIKPLKISHP